MRVFIQLHPTPLLSLSMKRKGQPSFIPKDVHKPFKKKKKKKKYGKYHPPFLKDPVERKYTGKTIKGLKAKSFASLLLMYLSNQLL